MLRKYVRVVVALAVVCAVTPRVTAQCIESLRPIKTGPQNPKNGFPLWLTDANGVSLELCLTGPGTGSGTPGPPPDYCFYDPIVAGNALSAQIGFGAEAFWWLAAPDFDTPYGNLLNDFKPTIDMAMEAAWATGEPLPGTNFPFTRLRIRFFPPAEGIYTITHPYGEEVYTATAAEVGQRITIVYDLPFDPMSTHIGKLGSVLVWDNSAPAPPAGYIGDSATSHKVTGSPCNFNRVRIRAVTAGGVPIDLTVGDAAVVNQVETDLFTILGKVSTRAGVHVARASYAKTAVDPGVEVFALTKPGQTISFTVNGTTTPMSTDGQGRYFGFLPTPTFLPAYPPTLLVKNESDPDETAALFKESQVNTVANDAVTITTAYYYRSDQRLQIQAKTTEPSLTCPTGFIGNRMTITGPDGIPVGPNGGNLPRTPSGYSLVLTGVAVPPPSITVTSCYGGKATVPLDVGAACSPTQPLCKAK